MVNSTDPGPSILITTTGGRTRDRGIFVAWPDGVIAWSDDVVSGGAPYRMGQVEASALSECLRELALDGRWLGERRLGPDARWTHLVVNESAGALIDVGSWHELAERNPNLVATATGLEPLDGRSRDAVLAAQRSSYVEFRQRWVKVKRRALALVQAAAELPGQKDRARMPWPDADEAT